jgi:hypothetical protein
MFKLDPNPTFVAPVSGFKPGEGVTESILVTFKYRGRKELSEFLLAVGDLTALDALMDIMVGWRDVPLDFTRENVEKLCDLYPAFVSAVFETYRAELTEARRKN